MENENFAESIKKEQLLLLYDNLIDDACNLYNAYKVIHNSIISRINKNIVQDIMKLKLNQSKELINLYNKINCNQYVNKKVKNYGKYKLAEMFARESNHGETLNYIYCNTNDINVKNLLQYIINNENLILLRLLYLQSLLGINWEANYK